MKTPFVCIAVLALLPWHVYADAEEATTILPGKAVPPHVRAQPGKLVLYADFNHVQDQAIDLYLINRTGNALSWPTQEGEPYIKLEALDATGSWARAQGHVDSFDGESYSTITLQDGQVLKTKGVYPRGGKPRPIRYSVLFGEKVTSNVGQGTVSDEAIEACRYDPMAMRTGPFDLVSRVALGTINVSTSAAVAISLRRQAILSLHRFEPRPTISLLRQLLADDKLPSELFGTAFDILKRVDGHEGAHYAASVLRDRNHPRRGAVLFMLYPMAGNEIIFPLLLRIVTDYQDPNAGEAMPSLGSTRLPEARATLRQVMHDTNAPPALREQARSALYSAFPNCAFTIRLDSPTYKASGNGPFPVSISVENRMKTPLELKGDSLWKYLSFHIISERIPGPVELKKQEAYFKPFPIPMPVIPPGGSMKVRIQLREFLDFPKPGTYIMRAHFEVPEVSEVPAFSYGMLTTLE